MTETTMTNGGRRTRVLVVDDEPSIAKGMASALTRAGYEALVSHSGDAALATLERERVDVLLIDLRIPDTRGDVIFELAAAMHPHLRRQTVFMTGDLSEKATRVIDTCKCPILRKPFELREMIAAIAAVAPHTRLDVRGQSA